jgi:hypothetical protein
VEHEESSGEYEPNFVLSHRDAVREDNWEGFAARGFKLYLTADPTDMSDQEFRYYLASAEATHGAANVYTGDCYDPDAGRPLRHKQGRSIYIDPAGIQPEE